MDIAYVLAGLAIGTIVGLTGVGGGSLMTPFLIYYGVPPITAVGTDLIYASITKSGAVWAHHRARNVKWHIVRRLAAGSIPAAIISILVLEWLDIDSERQEAVITTVLGVSLMLSALMLLFGGVLRRSSLAEHAAVFKKLHAGWGRPVTIAAGAVIGVLVTLSSVGAGALGGAVLVTLYPRMPATAIVAIDLAHAVLLTTTSGMGHLFHGSVNFVLLVSLLLGSLPGVAIGTRLGNHLPDYILRRILGTLLLLLGIGFVT
ncbi:MAG: sulfite exporter TauE/SafE family protein [Gammaproteobacteria bacterium]